MLTILVNKKNKSYIFIMPADSKTQNVHMRIQLCVVFFPLLPVYRVSCNFARSQNSLSAEVIQTGPLNHTGIINKTNTPHRVRMKLNTISCFRWNCFVRLVWIHNKFTHRGASEAAMH